MNHERPAAEHDTPTEAMPASAPETDAARSAAREIGGPRGLEPTRYGDWERNGRCFDF